MCIWSNSEIPFILNIETDAVSIMITQDDNGRIYCRDKLNIIPNNFTSDKAPVNVLPVWQLNSCNSICD